MTRSHVYRSHRPRGGVSVAAKVTGGLFVLLAVAWVTFAFFRSPPRPRLESTAASKRTLPGAALLLRPAPGVEEAVALGGVGTIAVAGSQSPTPIASLTKMMSALVVLHDHPLGLGAAGPEIAVTTSDVTAYRSERAAGDSVVAVRAGERLSELQALEGALIPSGDNVIQLLANWDAGSTAAFTAKMNALAHALGLRHTRYAGPSGVNPATVSTAADQLRLAEAAMTNPVFAAIVGMSQVTLPVAGVQYNVDADLGTNGIDGIKTGWIPQGGGCFAFAATGHVGGHTVPLLGAVLGEQGKTPIPTALSVGRQLVTSIEKTIATFQVPAGTPVATLSAAGGSRVLVATASTVSLLGWHGARAQVHIEARTFAPSSLPAGAVVGSLVVSLGSERQSTALRTTAPLRVASFAWRLSHL